MDFINSAGIINVNNFNLASFTRAKRVQLSPERIYGILKRFADGIFKTTATFKIILSSIKY